jgi:hypothetical protein
MPRNCVYRVTQRPASACCIALAIQPAENHLKRAGVNLRGPVCILGL